MRLYGRLWFWWQGLMCEWFGRHRWFGVVGYDVKTGRYVTTGRECWICYLEEEFELMVNHFQQPNRQTPPKAGSSFDAICPACTHLCRVVDGMWPEHTYTLSAVPAYGYWFAPQTTFPETHVVCAHGGKEWAGG